MYVCVRLHDHTCAHGDIHTQVYPHQELCARVHTGRPHSSRRKTAQCEYTRWASQRTSHEPLLPSVIRRTHTQLVAFFLRSFSSSFFPSFFFFFFSFFFFHLVSIRLRASAFEIEYSLVYVYTYIYVYVCVTASLPVLHSRSSSLSRTSRFLSFFSISMFVGKTLA